MIKESKYPPTASLLLLGYTLIELSMCLALIGILAVSGISFIDDVFKKDKFAATIKHMRDIRRALVGKSDSQDNTNHNYFGYLGDIGALPTNGSGISALLINPGYPIWALNNTVRFGVGWNGPYLVSSDPGVDFLKDAWGNDFIYNVGADSTTITSYAGDGVVGGSGYDQDIVVTIANSEVSSTIHGFISNYGAPITSGATVILYSPDGSGALKTASQNLPSSAKGYFTFANVPFGVNSLKVLIPSSTGSVITVGPARFTVESANYQIPVETFNLVGCVPAGVIILGSKGTISGKVVSYRLNYTSKVTVYSIMVSSSKVTRWQNLVLNAVNYDCTPPTYLTPICPVFDSDRGILSPAAVIAAGNNQAASLTFSVSMGGVAWLRVTYYHDKGCDIVDVLP